MFKKSEDLLHMNIYLYTCISVCGCVCVYVCWGAGCVPNTRTGDRPTHNNIYLS